MTNTEMNRDELIRQLAHSRGTRIVRSKDDGSWATDRAIPRKDAIALVADLERAGVEASHAMDQDDRSTYWVYVTIADEVG